MKRPRLAVLLVVGAACAGAFATLREADAQRIDPRRPSVVIVGSPGGPAPMQRTDARRTGRAKEPLPTGPLRIAWKKALGISVEQAALAGADGTLAVVTSRGDVAFLDASGDEVSHVSLGAGSGPATMTADGTVVFVTGGGDAIGVRRNSARPRFTTHLGGDRKTLAAPLALDDGGSVVVTTNDLVVLDDSGLVRSRASLPESPASPLVAAGDKVLAVTTSGAVFGWVPGREPVRLGSFGAPIDGGAALSDASTLVAVIEGNHVVELDLARGSRSTRAIAAQGLYLGPPSLSGASTTVLAMTQTRGFVVMLDGSGQEQKRAGIASLAPKTLPDGGAAPLVAPLHVGPLVDSGGAIAWAATDGNVGVVTAEGSVETLGELLCSSVAGRSGVAGLTPWGPSTFAVTCENGTVARIVGPHAEPTRKSSPPAPAPPTSAGRKTPPPPAPSEDDDDDGPLRRRP